MSLQQLYDDICSHLDRQGCQSLGSGGSLVPACMYRGVEGRKCAVGGILPDQYYTPNMEGMGAEELLGEYPELVEYIREHYHLGGGIEEVEDLLLRTQRVHDEFLVETWAVQFERAAIDFNLTPYTFTHPNIVGEKHD